MNANCVHSIERKPELARAAETDSRMKRRIDDGIEEAALLAERMPAWTLFYRLAPRLVSDDSHDGVSVKTMPTEGEALMLAAPSTTAGMRVCEYRLLRPALLARGGSTLPAAESLRGADGWRSADGQCVCLCEPDTLLQLIDDDKHVGRSQALLTDLFLRSALGSGQ